MEAEGLAGQEAGFRLRIQGALANVGHHIGAITNRQGDRIPDRDEVSLRVAA